MEENFDIKACEELLTQLFRNAIQAKEGIIKELKKLASLSEEKIVLKDVKIEYRIFNIIVFMNLQMLNNAYPGKNYDKIFLKIIQKKLGIFYYFTMKMKINRYKKIFNNSVKIGLNPLEEIIQDFFRDIIGRQAKPTESTAILIYFSHLPNLWKYVIE